MQSADWDLFRQKYIILNEFRELSQTWSAKINVKLYLPSTVLRTGPNQVHKDERRISTTATNARCALIQIQYYWGVWGVCHFQKNWERERSKGRAGDWCHQPTITHASWATWQPFQASAQPKHSNATTEQGPAGTQLSWDTHYLQQTNIKLWK